MRYHSFDDKPNENQRIILFIHLFIYFFFFWLQPFLIVLGTSSHQQNGNGFSSSSKNINDRYFPVPIFLRPLLLTKLTNIFEPKTELTHFGVMYDTIFKDTLYWRVDHFQRKTSLTMYQIPTRYLRTLLNFATYDKLYKQTNSFEWV